MRVSQLNSINLYKPAVFWFCVALIVRLVAGTAIHLYSLEAGYEGFVPLAAGADDAGYFDLASDIAAGRADQLEWIPTSYPYLLAGIFLVLGKSLIAGKLLNVILGSLAVYFAVLLTRRLNQEDTTSWKSMSNPVNLTGLILALYPSSVFYSTQMTKDSPLLFFGILSIFLFVRAMQTRRGWIWLVIAVAGLSDLRAYATLSIMLGIGIWFVLQPGMLRRHFFRIAIMAVLCVPVGYFLVQPYTGYFSLDELAKFRVSSYTGGSSVGITLDFSNPVSFVVSYVYNFLTVLAGPFPWQIQEPQHLIALFEAIPIYFLLPIVAMRFITTLIPRDPRDKLLFIVSMTQIAAFALLSDNIGTNARLRILAWSCLAMHFALTFPLMMKNIAAFFFARKSNSPTALEISEVPRGATVRNSFL